MTCNNLKKYLLPFMIIDKNLVKILTVTEYYITVTLNLKSSKLNTLKINIVKNILHVVMA